MANSRQKAAMAAVAAAAAAEGPMTFGARVASIPRLVRDVLAGRYDGLSRGRLGLMVLAVGYMLSPLDLVPESLVPVLGLADDAAIAGWLVAALFSATTAYRAWEHGRLDPLTGPRVQPW